MKTLNILHDRFQIGQHLQHLIVVGDGKSYDHLIKLKSEYGSALDWVLPYPGDWHILKNVLPIFIKIFYDAGIKELAGIYHHGATLKVLTEYAYKRQEVVTDWRQEVDSVLQNVLSSCEHTPESSEKCAGDILDVELWKSVLLQKSNLETLLESVCSNFSQWRFQNSAISATFKFWDTFIHSDFMAYLGLYIGIRSRNWNLRNISLKNWHAYFYAFDRQLPSYDPIPFSRSQTFPHTQEPVRDLDQFISLPRAISDAYGLPVKGTKSNALKVLKSTYKDAFLTSLPVTDDAVQSTVILEGMFLINTIPLSSHRTFIDYAEFLFTRWIVKSHIQFKAQEIHVVFDHPNRNGESPKDIERSRRTHEFNQENITYNTVSSDLLLPTNWRNFLNVRDRKRKFVNYLSSQLINFALQRFQDHECTVVTAGGYEDLYVDKALGAGDGDISEFSDFNSNHEEGDTRVWLHAIHSKSQRIIIYSPNTDTFFVELPFIDCLGDKTIYLQLKDSTFDHQFVDMHRFSLQMSNEMCLKELGNSENCIQMVYIASGCDFVSFFHGYGKKNLFRHISSKCQLHTE
ncbi:unnamed protein product [Mytilus coruscus]|uniref:Uncharacterized protein n=1 Tax=Mytilus coruscus TaxID=42192 RepID=A0A6J8AR09_MYTCO|nr:unnamed protein product [Mytilus coruscus]